MLWQTAIRHPGPLTIQNRNVGAYTAANQRRPPGPAMSVQFTPTSHWPLYCLSNFAGFAAQHWWSFVFCALAHRCGPCSRWASLRKSRFLSRECINIQRPRPRARSSSSLLLHLSCMLKISFCDRLLFVVSPIVATLDQRSALATIQSMLSLLFF